MRNRNSLLERYKAMVRDEPPPAPKKESYRAPTEEEWGAYLRLHGFTWAQAVDLRHDPRCAWRYDPAGIKDFARGYTGDRPCVHFVGMQDSRQYANAVRMWGAPDYDWPTANFRMMGECAPGDTVVFGASAFVKPKKWRSAR